MSEIIEGEIVEGADVKKDGGVYLVVADETEEFRVALRYAARRAQANRLHLGIMRIITIDEFQHWGNVEEIMRRELREQAEKYLWSVARDVHDLTGMTPVLYIGEGDPHDVVASTIENDLTIRTLMLAGSTSSAGPGAMVSYFTGRGLHRLRIPVLVIPGNIDAAKIDRIAGL